MTSYSYQSSESFTTAASATTSHTSQSSQPFTTTTLATTSPTTQSSQPFTTTTSAMTSHTSQNSQLFTTTTSASTNAVLQNVLASQASNHITSDPSPLNVPVTYFFGLSLGVTCAILIVGTCVVTLIVTFVTYKVVRFIKRRKQDPSLLRLSVCTTTADQPAPEINTHPPERLHPPSVCKPHHNIDSCEDVYTDDAMESPEVGLYANFAPTYIHPCCDEGQVVPVKDDDDDQDYLKMDMAKRDQLLQQTGLSHAPGLKAQLYGSDTYENSLQKLNVRCLTNVHDLSASTEGSDYVSEIIDDLAVAHELSGAPDGTSGEASAGWEYQNLQTLGGDCFQDAPKGHSTTASREHLYAVVDKKENIWL